MAKKILVVEDEHILSDMYADRFQADGWKVSTASTKNEGLAVTKKEHPDIVLLDILLFDGHGTEYLREKKQDDSIAQIPVVVFSNLDDPKIRAESLELGALDYLLKTDYTPQELMQKISSYL
jgi:DNA-binding response OmpR family regulator